MGSVFDGQTKVGRAVADPRTDNMLPNPGSLTFPAISTPVAVAGTVGALSTLVHGDRWEQLDGSLMEITNANVTTTIMGNETKSITGNQTLTTTSNLTSTVVGNVTHTVVGAELHTNIGAQNHTRMAPRVETYAGSENKEEPGGHFHVIDQWIKSNNLNMEISVYKVAAILFKVDVVGEKVDVFADKTQAGDIQNCVIAMKDQAVMGLRLYADTLRNNIAAMALVAKLTTASVNPEVHLPPEATISIGAPSPR
ncbi:MAG TPA: hypothetical protein VGS27_29720 [Candidatus Sulfotelmatobacter sp.]|nr:hypothetical protein [Candidatus Sulfotelmatobacter sp.]